MTQLLRICVGGRTHRQIHKDTDMCSGMCVFWFVVCLYNRRKWAILFLLVALAMVKAVPALINGAY
jgi:hypothetical protein